MKPQRPNRIEPARLRRATHEDGAAIERRRDFLKLLALTLGAGDLIGCARAPDDPIVPAVQDAPGAEDTPRYYATALAPDGYGVGVLVKTRYGHPVKIEGNPAHPASRGGTSPQLQAAIRALWDSQRARTVLQNGRLATWPAFRSEYAGRVAAAAARNGAGLRVLSTPSTSPTLARLRAEFAARLPAAVWHTYGPLPRDNAYAGARLAFGSALEPRFDFARADVVLALDADFVTALPGSLRYARDFAARRQPAPGRGVARLYCVESQPTPTSVLADHRIALGPDAMLVFLQAVHAFVTGASVPGGLDESQRSAAAAIARDLAAHRGAGLVLCADHLPPQAHALAHALNEQLGNAGASVAYGAPLLDETDQLGSIAALAAALAANTVDTLVVLGGNPAYTAPADLDFGNAIARAHWSAHLGGYADETSLACDWHVPQAHSLESWSDARAYDGSASIVQPAIAPLHDGRTPAELVALALGDPRGAYALVRDTWQPRMGTQFETAWRDALRDGNVGAPASAPVTPTLRGGEWPQLPARAAAARDEVDLLFRADASIVDSDDAANAWLQELPKPFTQLTWDNAALLAPATAQRLRLRDGDVVAIGANGARVDAPVLTFPGHAENALTLPLGYGRSRAVGDATLRGFDAGRLRTRAAFWHARGRIHPTGRSCALALAQPRGTLGEHAPIRLLELDALDAPLPALAPEPQRPSLFERARAAQGEGHAWGMVINLGACTGCNACTIACQAENNIPTVGAEQVRRGRVMHWMRIDHYVEEASSRSATAQPRLHAQPVPCMHCERAPCELVCPVGATLHDSEGLNLQVYNRCVGTRFCANNCPYKVRRFNFLQYTTAAMRDYANPEVTVRSRGVMEKCSYCIQRIETARIAADAADRALRDGEIVTACQAACPTRAIVFGDMHDPDSALVRVKSDPRNYALLAELNTAPRTTYLAKLLAPNPELKA